MSTLHLVIVAVLAVCWSAPALEAHHSFAAEFDGNKPITLKGRVTKVEMINPHGWIYVDVTASDGKVTNWAIEVAGANGLLRRGWRKDSLQPGFEVTIQGYLARDGSPTANGTVVTLANGQKLFSGSPEAPGQ